VSAARLFAAVDLPGEVRSELASWARRGVGGRSELRLVPEENLHLTLVFLGWRDEEDAARIGSLVVECAAGPIEASLGDALWLAPRRPHVLTVALDAADEALSSLQSRVQEALVRGAGHEPEDRPFRPHVTVARVRGRERVRPSQIELPPVPRATFGLRALTLYRSRPGPGGSRYEPVARVGLA
jgi:RNA 2',3'-cyclic 3'-phosphodiesterase